jgi:hypothetical protein
LKTWLQRKLKGVGADLLSTSKFWPAQYCYSLSLGSSSLEPLFQDYVVGV